MKRIFDATFSFWLMFLVNSSDLVAQGVVMPQRLDKYKCIDTSLFIITYDVTIINDISNSFHKQKDIQILEIGKHLSKSYSKLLFEADSINTAAFKSGAETSSLFQGVVPPIEVYKNYLNKKITITYRTFLGGPIYLYVEDKINFNWKILDDKKNFLTYSCQKAITTFRGRTYEAWFTTEIPFSEGPYKFSGLPGLILQIQDTKGHYVYNCISIQKVKNKDIIKMWSWKYEPTTREKLNALLKQIYERPLEFVNSMGTKVMDIDKSGKPKEADHNKKFPFNPIELE